MITKGEGGIVTITAGSDTPLATDYRPAAWASNGKYKRDDQVSTASTDGTSETKYWLALDDHAAASGDTTGGSATKAPTLDADHWVEIDTGELAELENWTETRPVTTDEGARLMREEAARSSNKAGAITLALNFLDNFEGSKTQRVLRKTNERLYVQLYPKGKGAGLEKRHGYMRVGEGGSAGEPDSYLSNSVTLTGDGDWTSEAQGNG